MQGHKTPQREAAPIEKMLLVLRPTIQPRGAELKNNPADIGYTTIILEITNTCQVFCDKKIYFY